MRPHLHSGSLYGARMGLAWDGEPVKALYFVWAVPVLLAAFWCRLSGTIPVFWDGWVVCGLVMLVTAAIVDKNP